MNEYIKCCHGIKYTDYCEACEIMWMEEKLNWLIEDVAKLTKGISNVIEKRQQARV